MSSAETIKSSQSGLNTAINTRITNNINDFFSNANNNNYYMIRNNSSFKEIAKKINFIKNLNDKIRANEILFTDANSKYGNIISITLNGDNIVSCTYTKNDATTGKNKVINMGKLDNFLLKILIISSNIIPNIRLYSIFSQYTFNPEIFTDKNLKQISIDKFDETFFNTSPPKLTRQNAISQAIISTPAVSTVKPLRKTATQIISEHNKRLSKKNITPGQPRSINRFSSSENTQRINNEINGIYAIINIKNSIDEKITELNKVINSLKTMEQQHYTPAEINLIITKLLIRVIYNSINKLRGAIVQTQELTRIIDYINITIPNINNITHIKNEVIKKINEEKRDRLKRDKELMPPPPRSTSKRQKLGGGSKIITRKIYINNDGKSFIKFNKNLIIYLK